MSKIHELKFYNEKWQFVPIVTCDGYSFGDRLLEGVIFYFEWNNELEQYKYSHTDAGDYMEQLNVPYWVEVAEDYIQSTDMCESPDGQELIRGEEIHPQDLAEAEKAQ